MRVKKRLFLNTAVSMAAAMIVFFLFLISYIRIDEANKAAALAGDLITTTLEEVNASNEYARNKNAHAKEQWHAKHERIGQLLQAAEERFDSAGERMIVKGLVMNHAEVRRVFLGIVSSGSAQEASGALRRVEEGLLDRMNALGIEAVAQSRTLLVLSRQARVAILKRAGASVLIAMLMTIAGEIVASRILGKAISDRIGKLRDGAAVIGDGNLDHRIDIKGDDEFGELADAFNTMTANLRASQDKIEREIAVRRRAEEALQREHDLMQIVMNGAKNTHLVFLDRDFNFVRVNEAYATTCGYRPEEMIGKNHFALYPHAENEAIFRRVRDTGEAIEVHDKPFEFPDQPERGVTYWDWTLTPVKEQGGDVAGLVFSLHETTERKRAETQLELVSDALANRNLELEASNKEMEAFIYSISHDLRAPLRSVAEFARIVQEDYAAKLDDQGNDYLSRVGKGAAKMSRLIDDLLRLSRITRQDLLRTDFDMSGAAQNIVRELREGQPDRRVTIDIQDGLRVHADPRLMDVALANLIGNAWKFTAKTENAHIELGRTEQDGATVYCVRDNGAGFDPAFADKMFWPFQRLHSQEEFEGTGIGLTIVERIIRRHGGRVWAEGEPGKGAAVYFTLG